MPTGTDRTATGRAVDDRPLGRQVVASNGFSLVALTFAVLASVVGATLTAALGTDQLGRLGGAAVGPVVTATFTTWWSGGRGRVQLLAIAVLSALALVITVSGFLVADTVAEKPVLGGGRGSIVPADVVGSPIDPGTETGTGPGTETGTDGESGTGTTGGSTGVTTPLPDLTVSAVPVTGGVEITVSNADTAADAGTFTVLLDGELVDTVDALSAGSATGITAACPGVLTTAPTASVVFTDPAVVDADVADNSAVVTGACPG